MPLRGFPFPPNAPPTVQRLAFFPIVQPHELFLSLKPLALFLSVQSLALFQSTPSPVLRLRLAHLPTPLPARSSGYAIRITVRPGNGLFRFAERFELEA